MRRTDDGGQIGGGAQAKAEKPREYTGVDNAGNGLWRAVIPSIRNSSVLRNLGVFPTVSRHRVVWS